MDISGGITSRVMLNERCAVADGLWNSRIDPDKASQWERNTQEAIAHRLHSLVDMLSLFEACHLVGHQIDLGPCITATSRSFDGTFDQGIGISDGGRFRRCYEQCSIGRPYQCKYPWTDTCTAINHQHIVAPLNQAECTDESAPFVFTKIGESGGP